MFLRATEEIMAAGVYQKSWQFAKCRVKKIDDCISYWTLQGNFQEKINSHPISETVAMTTFAEQTVFSHRA